MIQRKTWDEFYSTGLLFAINQFLHIFGYAIIVKKENGIITDVYPARVKFRGFDKNSVYEEYVKISEYMKENSKELLKESKE